MFGRKKKNPDGTIAPKKPKPAPLLEDDIQDDIIDPLVEEDKTKRREDKIFGNSFNLGSVEHENFHEVKIETGYATSNLGDCYDTDDYYQRKKIMDEVVVIFDKSQWHEMPLGKKFPKEVLPYIFQELYLGLQGKGYTNVDIFICISEFMDLSYEKVYEAAGISVKELLIKELEISHGTLAKKKINRLF